MVVAGVGIHESLASQRSRLPVIPSGDLLSKGEPLGASGLGQVHELVQRVRGRCGSCQLDGACVGPGHVMGAGHNSSGVAVGA